ncbi:coiled-coil domain-containing protein [Micavibrio aeruginosavorus]|uniref:Uncharacterized protein n=1 Tax=Micavibrio aeruginosavorus (strain ARL-13) TaxID=856793 RepID=G2KRB9_MICAA|nr:hypothetical protein [Micavibrio aeruginosavorus]AEP09166.1 hypothetical protein MICA_833 [Micavibrio aeruginosavorus ARL-13]
MAPNKTTDIQVEVLQGEDGTRFYKDIPDYRTADEETRALMDAMIDGVDWRDLNTIIGFGKEAKDGVLQVSRKINERVMADNSFIAEMRECADAVSGLDMGALTQRLDDLAKGGFDIVKNNKAEVGTGLALAMFVNPIVGLLAGLGMKGARVGKEKYDQVKGKVRGEMDHAKEAEAARDDLRKAILTTRALVEKLETAKEKIPSYINEVNAMGGARTKAYGALTLAIGAGQELQRRFYEEILPAEQENGAISLEELQQLQMAGDVMARTVEGLLGSRANSLQNIVTLSESLKMYTQMYVKIEEHLTSSVGEWEGQIAHGNLMVDRIELQAVITAADKKSADLAEKSEKLHETSRVMHQKSMEQGTFHLAQIAASTERLAQRLSSEMLTITDQSRRHVAAQERLEQATQTLAETFQSNAQKRAQLLVGSATSDKLSLRFEQKAAGNDNAPDVAEEAQVIEQTATAGKAERKPRAPRTAKPAAKPE